MERFGPGGDITVSLINEDGSAFKVLEKGEEKGEVHWDMTGEHSVKNGVAAILAARHCGVTLADACEALCRFEGVKRRMEVVGEVKGVSVYDDFAHHPTAIATTLEGLRRKVGSERIVAVIDPRSNTMKMGVHQSRLADSARLADAVIWHQPPGMGWSLDEVVKASVNTARVGESVDGILEMLKEEQGPVHIVIMSNGGFGGIHRKLLEQLAKQ